MLFEHSMKLHAMALCAMFSFSALAPVAAAPTPRPPQARSQASGPSTSYWLSQNYFHKNGPVYGTSDSKYPLFRNVMDPQFGAKGDGVTDDSAAINFAINSTGGVETRCGVG